MIKLVVTDVDGTIVAKDEILHPEVPALAKQLRRQGIIYTIATGRVESQVEEYVKQLELDDTPYIACNGGVIVRGGQVCSAALFRWRRCVRRLRWLRRWRCQCSTAKMVWSVPAA